jgi:hypothetical protein
MVQVLGTHHAHLVDNAIAIQAVFAFAAECLKEIVTTRNKPISRFKSNRFLV